MKTRIILMIAAIAIAFAFTACGGDDDNRVDHTGKIEAFDRTINVVGDKNISAADFAKAVGNLQTAMATLCTNLVENPLATNIFINMLDRQGFKIVITTDNVQPDESDEKKSMIIGLSYLLNSNTIDSDIYKIVVTQDLFAKVTPVDSKSNPINSNLFAKQELA